MEEFWDDSALIKAYEKAVNSFKVQLYTNILHYSFNKERKVSGVSQQCNSLIFMQFTDQNNGGRASLAFLLGFNIQFDWLEVNVRNKHDCVMQHVRQTSKVPILAILVFVVPVADEGTGT